MAFIGVFSIEIQHHAVIGKANHDVQLFAFTDDIGQVTAFHDVVADAVFTVFRPSGIGVQVDAVMGIDAVSGENRCLYNAGRRSVLYGGIPIFRDFRVFNHGEQTIRKSGHVLCGRLRKLRDFKVYAVFDFVGHQQGIPVEIRAVDFGCHIS